MQVETFECTETASEPIEATEEAVSIIEQLDLAGQRELIKPKSDEGFASRCPYRIITAEEEFVYRTLCPTRTRLETYNAGPIPLRVLQIAAHAQSLGLFKRLQVWDKESHVVVDPVLIASTKDSDYSWDNNRTFILARWGEVLETFSTLLTKAIAMKRAALIQQAEALVNQVRAKTDAELIKAGADKEIAWQ